MEHEIYMRRCLDLALLGGGNVAPNPMVGSVLVHEGRIIGEGYHRQYGGPHAEVNCIRSVRPEDRPLIPQSTIYVSLEPCAHFGKTPPCADLVIEQRIARVVVGCRDPFLEVNGKGIEKIRAAGIPVELGILEQECLQLNKRFFTFHTAHRPYVILKWAQTADGRIAPPATGPDSRLLISNAYSNRLVHKWRGEEMAILVGTNTALKDNPELNTRLWPGPNPIRLVVDKDLRLPPSLKLFNGVLPTLVFNLHQHTLPFGKISATDLRQLEVAYYQITEDVSLVHQVLNALYSLGIQSVLVEGGSRLLQSFIDEGAWDEARVITAGELAIGRGLPAPVLSDFRLARIERFAADTHHHYARRPNAFV
ncbi:bifunctional diaminohydroxyphosphoribosylaminopyrimidine deaminase/5-amino-6-(5-phosphoribosylamino)uracil reductase RibD [Paraflavisolibacter sp. H34]|uniref:bifunctional diaminohydroxyphosphoribosylaminopyrimidine deaminase/5-amino-6-(5-phosphoribosylamino)uracil reductase RibD n=1 Tax=Huijunlia imazamoxiresistens TaxID=3127457 RepID=UPI003018D396